jgi:hypothetical protein
MDQQYRNAQIAALRAKGAGGGGGAGGGKISQQQISAARMEVNRQFQAGQLTREQAQYKMREIDMLTVGAGKGGDVFAGMLGEQRNQLVTALDSVLGSDSLDARTKLYNDLIPDGYSASWTQGKDGGIELEVVPDDGGDSETMRFGNLAELDKFAVERLPPDIRQEMDALRTKRARGLDYGLPQMGTVNPMELMEAQQGIQEMLAEQMGGNYAELNPAAQQTIDVQAKDILRQQFGGLQDMYPSAQAMPMRPGVAPRVGITDRALGGLFDEDEARIGGLR